MAKRRQLLTLGQIESKLGYKIDSLENAEDEVDAFYSDLTAVPKSSYERALRDLDENKKRTREAASSYELPLPGEPRVSQFNLTLLFLRMDSSFVGLITSRLFRLTAIPQWRNVHTTLVSIVF